MAEDAASAYNHPDTEKLASDRKITKADILDAFDKRAARLVVVEDEREGLGEEVGSLLGRTEEIHRQLKAANFEIHKLDDVAQLYRDLATQLVDQALQMVHWEVGEYNHEAAKRLLKAIQGDTEERVNQVLSRRYGMEMSEASTKDMEPPTTD